MSLTVVTFLPLAGAIALLLMRASGPALRSAAFLVSLFTLILSLPLMFLFDPTSAEMQFVTQADWIPALGIRYALGLDGISLFLLLLTTFITPLAILAAWPRRESPESDNPKPETRNPKLHGGIQDREREFYALMLVLETGMIGVFAATDLFLFYVFWEAALIPMYLIIGIWGGPERRYATTKFVLYTMAGSLLMFVAILYVYARAGQVGGDDAGATFAIAGLIERLNPGANASRLSPPEQYWLFLAFGVAFAIKVPLFPFHTWLPNAHVEAPTSGSVVLAAVLLKMGVYGFLRLAVPLFPDAAVDLAPLLCAVAIVGIVYGAIMALAQQDMKKLIAYSSVSHLGYCMLGIFALNATGIAGGIFQMLAHGVGTGALFVLVGMLYERRHSRLIDRYGGLASSTPVLTVLFVIVTLSAIGLPLTGGFVGEFLVLLGAFQVSWVYALIAGTGVILGAVYMLNLLLRVFFGPIRHEECARLPDVTRRELAVVLPLVAMIFIMGLFPRLFLRPMEPSIQRFLSRVQPAIRRKAERERSRHRVVRGVSGFGFRVSGFPTRNSKPETRNPSEASAP